MPKVTKQTLFKQCFLLSEDGNTMIAWLEADKIKRGINVTLDDSDNPKMWWTIIRIYPKALAKEDIKDSHYSGKWHRNDYHGKLNGLVQE